MQQTLYKAFNFMRFGMAVFLSALLMAGSAVAGIGDSNVNNLMQSPSHGYTKPGASVWLASNSHVLIENNSITNIDVQLGASEIVGSVSVRVRPSEGLDILNAQDVWELTQQDQLRFTLELSAGSEGQYYLDLNLTTKDFEGNVQSRAVSISVVAAADIKAIDKNRKKALANKALKSSGVMVSGDGSDNPAGPVKVFKAQESSP